MTRNRYSIAPPSTTATTYDPTLSRNSMESMAFTVGNLDDDWYPKSLILSDPSFSDLSYTGLPGNTIPWDIRIHNAYQNIVDPPTPVSQSLMNFLEPYVPASRDVERLRIQRRVRERVVSFQETNNTYFKYPELTESEYEDIAQSAQAEKEEIGRKILAIVAEQERRRQGGHGSSTSDPYHPNFPFPAGYTRIDFDHLNPTNFVALASKWTEHQRMIQEPYIKHSRKMKELEESYERNENKLRLSLSPRKEPLVARKTSGSQKIVFYHQPYSDVRKALSRQYKMDREDLAIVRKHWRIRKALLAAEHERDAQLRMLMEKSQPGYAWHKGASTEGFWKPEVPPPTPPFVPKASTVAMVQEWLDKYFTIRPVPLLLHVPKNLSELMGVPKTVNLVPRVRMSTMKPLPGTKVPPSNVPAKPQAGDKRREINVIDGLVWIPKVINGEIENSFLQGYDLSPLRDLVKLVNGPVEPHRFRYVLPFEEFLDNEILFQCEGNMLHATARSAGKPGKNPRKTEEVVEIPDGVPLIHLKFYRSLDNKIVIEEEANRPKHRPKFTEIVSVRRY